MGTGDMVWLPRLWDAHGFGSDAFLGVMGSRSCSCTWRLIVGVMISSLLSQYNSGEKSTVVTLLST